MKKYLKEDRMVKKYRDGNQRLQSVPHMETNQRLRTNPQELTMQKTFKLWKSGNIEIVRNLFR